MARARGKARVRVGLGPAPWRHISGTGVREEAIRVEHELVHQKLLVGDEYILRLPEPSFGGHLAEHRVVPGSGLTDDCGSGDRGILHVVRRPYTEVDGARGCAGVGHGVGCDCMQESHAGGRGLQRARRVRGKGGWLRWLWSLWGRWR